MLSRSTFQRSIPSRLVYFETGQAAIVLLLLRPGIVWRLTCRCHFRPELLKIKPGQAIVLLLNLMLAHVELGAIEATTWCSICFTTAIILGIGLVIIEAKSGHEIGAFLTCFRVLLIVTEVGVVSFNCYVSHTQFTT